MIGTVHFLRPWWFLAIIPLVSVVLIFWKNMPKVSGWSSVCDSHLLVHLLKNNYQSRKVYLMASFFLSILFMILSASGPSWHQMPVPTYKLKQPRVLILDMSSNMMAKDLTPDRLSRAKFKIHDLLAQKDKGQFGLVVFTGEPFVVSPLTDDGQTITSLLPALTTDIMPVGGRKLDLALTQARQLMQQAGYAQGSILVLTADAPSDEDISMAKQLAQDGFSSSIMPMKADKHINPLFDYFAQSGKGQVIPYSSDSSDLDQWMNQTERDRDFGLTQDQDIALWRDEGRWFLIPALVFLLPVFRRGFVDRMAL